MACAVLSLLLLLLFISDQQPLVGTSNVRTIAEDDAPRNPSSRGNTDHDPKDRASRKQILPANHSVEEKWLQMEKTTRQSMIKTVMETLLPLLQPLLHHNKV